MRDLRVEPDEATDDELLAAYGAGDAAAARLLTARLAPRLLAQAYRMLGDRAEAEDVTQETMLRLWRAAPGWIAGAAQPSTWAFRVAHNLCIDRLRRRRGVDLDAIDEPADDRPGPEASMQDMARLEALREAIASLPDRQGVALTMRHLEGRSNPEIAEALGIGVEAVESLTARAKRQLGKTLGGRKKELGYDES